MGRNFATWLRVVTMALVTTAAAGQPPRAEPVVVSPVVQHEVSIGQTFVGTVMPSMKAIVGSAVDGRVIEFPLNEGDRVAQGQPLAQLLTDTITLEVSAAEAELELRRQALAELENGTRPEEIEQARARMNAAEARTRYTSARRVRFERLFESNRAVSEEEREEAVAAAIEAEQAYLEAKSIYEMAVQGPRVEQIAQARAQVAFQQATVDRLKDQLAKHTIISRFDGYVTAEHTEVGQWVQQGDPVAEVAALDVVEVSAHVVEQHVPFIRPGVSVRVEIPAVKDRVFTGEVTAIVPQADVQARTFPVKVRVRNETTDDGPLLKSGMYARVTLPTGDRQMALLVSKDALVLGGPQPVVFVVDTETPDAREGKARLVPVQLGVAEGSLIQVIGPLEPGQLVIVHGNERVRPGQDVAVQATLPPPVPQTADAVSRTDLP